LKTVREALTGAMNGYPADERQVVDRADRVSLAAGVVANFDLYNRQAKVPRRNGTARPRERQYRKARCSRNSFGTQARPQPFRLDKKLRPLLFVADATLTPGSTADRHQRAFRSAKALASRHAPAPASDMTSPAVLAAQPASAALPKIGSAARAARAEALPRNNRFSEPNGYQQNLFDRFSIKGQ
jgi:hypothetical protein